MSRFYALIAAIAVAAFLLYSSVFIVNEREQAIVLRFGEIRRVIEEPGVYFKLPTAFVDTVQFIEDRILSFEIQNIRVQVRDGRRYLVDAFVAFRITDPQKFRENVSGSIQLAQENLRTRLDASLRRVYGQRSFEAALSEQRAAMMQEVASQLRPLAAQLGIEIVDVRIVRTDLLPEVSQQTFERMRAERLAEAAELRARGTERAAQIRAEADREAVVTLAGAERDAQILRGEGDAERNRVFAEAYSRDPQFFDFYRSMNAYSAALQGDTTTLVLSPTSEFFRFFKDDGEGTLPAEGVELPPLAPSSGEFGASGELDARARDTGSPFDRPSAPPSETPADEGQSASGSDAAPAASPDADASTAEPAPSTADALDPQTSPSPEVNLDPTPGDLTPPLIQTPPEGQPSPSPQ